MPCSASVRIQYPRLLQVIAGCAYVHTASIAANRRYLPVNNIEAVNLSAYAFPLYVIVHFCVFLWCISLARKYQAPGAWLTAMIAIGLVYDNFILSIGMSLGAGPLLEMLSLPRFVMHALLTPFMMIAATQIAVAGGIRWAATPQWRIAVWILVVGMILLGTIEHLVGLELYPACFDGVMRYTTSLYPAHFCFAGQVESSGGGAPIPSIVGNVLTLVVGFSLWRTSGWPWLMAGALVMFAAASVPMKAFGMAPGNAGETVLLLSYAATVYRFGRRDLVGVAA